MRKVKNVLILVMVLAAGVYSLAACVPSEGSQSHPTTILPGYPGTQGIYPTVTTEAYPSGSTPGASFTIIIPAFTNGGDIPVRYTCSGDNVSPAIQLANLSQGTNSLALIVEDPDAPGGTYIHWVLYNIPPTLTELPEAILPGARVPGIGTQGKNSSGAQGYGGPCPPPGSAHHYHFRAFTLDLDPSLPADLTAAQLEGKMNGHVLGEADWVGLFKR